ncbi:MAG TPA: hypothetical protein VNW98_08570, partial [Burkholderiaceae bacterium]|nr:hypothetical protein [Burkholderiaceae bacterium]
MSRFELCLRGAAALLLLVALPAGAQSFRVQCPTSTITHPDPSGTGVNNAEPTYSGPTTFALGPNGYQVPSNVNGAIKCQQISGGDGYATMADGHQTFMFSFGPLSGLQSIAFGNPDGAFDRGTGASFPSVFNTVYPGTLLAGDPATSDGASDSGTAYVGGSGGSTAAPFTYNGAVGLTPDQDCLSNPVCAPTIPAGGLDGHVDPRQIM